MFLFLCGVVRCSPFVLSQRPFVPSPSHTPSLCLLSLSHNQCDARVDANGDQVGLCLGRKVLTTPYTLVQISL
jgi:hypothetical protein